MKQILRIGCLIFSLVCGGLASAETATWTGNAEPDVEAYDIYACAGASCIVRAEPSMLTGTVQHVGPGVRHTFAIDLTGKDGSLAILARDTSKNKSGLSVSVPFDKAPPSIPATPTLQ